MAASSLSKAIQSAISFELAQGGSVPDKQPSREAFFGLGVADDPALADGLLAQRQAFELYRIRRDSSL